MDEILTQDLKKQFAALPVEVQKAISDVNLPIKLQEIVKNNKLMIDQAGGLETETILVLFGLESLENYVDNLVENVGFSRIQASIIAHDVNESVFKNIRENLKKMNDEMLEANKEVPENENNPTKEDVLAGIEHPEDIKNNEESISMSSLKSNGINQEKIKTMERGVEIRVDNLPEIAPEAILPVVSSLTSKKQEPFHVNIPPVKNMVESKLKNTVVVPKQTIVVEEKTKLPTKPKLAGDPYREPII